MKKRTIISAVAVVTAALAMTGNAMYNMALKTGGNRERIFKAEENQTKSKPELKDTSGFADEWITAYDGLKLHGYVCDRKSPVFVIAMHGYSLEGRTMMAKCEGWEKRGYSMLYPDMRGHGKSEGKYIGMGWHDRKDIVSWIDHINEVYHPKAIILYGISMGGAAVMMAAGESLADNVKCLIEDCGYVSVKEEFRHEGKVVFGIPYYPLVFVGSLITKLRAGYTFEEASAIEGLKRSRVPIMFIHGTADRFVPAWNARKAYECAAGPKELMLVTDAEHAQSQEKDPELYWNRVYGFADRYLEEQ